jgi:hypothetical protein
VLPCADLRDFTALSEASEPAAMIATLDAKTPAPPAARWHSVPVSSKKCCPAPADRPIRRATSTRNTCRARTMQRRPRPLSLGRSPDLPERPLPPALSPPGHPSRDPIPELMKLGDTPIVPMAKKIANYLAKHGSRGRDPVAVWSGRRQVDRHRDLSEQLDRYDRPDNRDAGRNELRADCARQSL